MEEISLKIDEYFTVQIIHSMISTTKHRTQNRIENNDEQWFRHEKVLNIDNNPRHQIFQRLVLITLKIYKIEQILA